MVVVGLRRAAGEGSGFEAPGEPSRAPAPARGEFRAWGAEVPEMRAASARRPRRCRAQPEGCPCSCFVFAPPLRLFIQRAPVEGLVEALRLPCGRGVVRGTLRAAFAGYPPDGDGMGGPLSFRETY